VLPVPAEPVRTEVPRPDMPAEQVRAGLPRPGTPELPGRGAVARPGAPGPRAGAEAAHPGTRGLAVRWGAVSPRLPGPVGPARVGQAPGVEGARPGEPAGRVEEEAPPGAGTQRPAREAAKRMEGMAAEGTPEAGRSLSRSWRRRSDFGPVATGRMAGESKPAPSSWDVPRVNPRAVRAHTRVSSPELRGCNAERRRRPPARRGARRPTRRRPSPAAPRSPRRGRTAPPAPAP